MKPGRGGPAGDGCVITGWPPVRSRAPARRSCCCRCPLSRTAPERRRTRRPDRAAAGHGMPGRGAAQHRHDGSLRHVGMRGADERDNAGGVRRRHRRAVQPRVVVAARVLRRAVPAPPRGRGRPPSRSTATSTRPRLVSNVGVWNREPPGAVTSVMFPYVEYHDSRFSAPVAVTTTTPGISVGRTTQLLLTGRVTAAPGGKSGLISSMDRVVEVDALVAGGRDQHDAPLLRVAGGRGDRLDDRPLLLVVAAVEQPRIGEEAHVHDVEVLVARVPEGVDDRLREEEALGRSGLEHDDRGLRGDAGDPDAVDRRGHRPRGVRAVAGEVLERGLVRAVPARHLLGRDRTSACPRR